MHEPHIVQLFARHLLGIPLCRYAHGVERLDERPVCANCLFEPPGSLALLDLRLDSQDAMPIDGERARPEELQNESGSVVTPSEVARY